MMMMWKKKMIGKIKTSLSFNNAINDSSRNDHSNMNLTPYYVFIRLSLNGTHMSL